MLQIIRSALGSIFVKALFVLLIASFAVWGVGDIFGGPAAGRAAVSVGDVRISTQTVADEFDRQRSQLGPQVTPQIAIQIGLGAATGGAVLVFASLLWERIEEREADRELKKEL